MYLEFKEKLGLSKANQEKLRTINTILDKYMEDGFRLTLRQLYYQLVAGDIIPNKQAEYSKLSTILKKGRMAGHVDWDAIEDRIRVPRLPYWVNNVDHAILETIDQFRLNRMKGQDHRIEIWVEKDALSNVLYRISSKYHIRLMVNRGYSSVSAMFRASRRLNNDDIILYFGDHDPSGIDMIRDIKERLLDFRKDIRVIPVALTMPQINRFNPPPNPTKINDPRAKDYLKEYGNTSWELDALPPRELIRMAENAVLEHIDLDIYNSMLSKEQESIEEIKEFFNK